MDRNPIIFVAPKVPTNSPENATYVELNMKSGQITRKASRRHVDGGWAWVVLAAAFVIHSIVFGMTMGMGIFYSEFLDEFKRGPVATSWLISSNCALVALAGPIGSILANKFGFRPVIIAGASITSVGFFLSYFVYDFSTLFWAFGITTGFGLGIVYAPSFGILALYFDKRKTIATSFCTVGIGVGMFMVPPIERLLIAYVTWRGACLILAGISLNIIPCAMLFTGHVAPVAPSLSQSADISLFKKPSFYVMIANFFLMGAFNIWMIIGLRYVMDYRGISKDDAPLLISVQGVFSICGRLSAVAIGLNRWTSSRTIRFGVFHIATVSAGIALIIYSVVPDFLGLCVVSGCIGYFMGLRYALLPALLIEIFSAKRFSTTWSYGMCTLGVGSLVLPPLGEWIAEMTQDGQAPFYLCGACILLTCSCSFVLQFCLPTFKKTDNGKQLKLLIVKPSGSADAEVDNGQPLTPLI